MKKEKHIPLHNHWLKSLLLLPLLLSFVHSSGYAESLHSPQPQKARVELALTARPVNKKALSFTKALRNVQQPAPFAIIYHALYQQLILHHDRLLKACCTDYNKQLLFFPVTRNFAHLKVIPQNSDEDLSNSYKG